MSRANSLAMVAVLIFACWASAAGPTTAPSTQRTPAQINAIVEQAGRTAPAWWNSVALKYPPTLDLNWDAQGPWNPQKNLGQYLWDVINPNPNRWPEGVKLLHHVLTVHKNDPKKLERTMNALARMYVEMLQDYPRGAFWAKKSGDELLLAQCYWKMGSKPMAVQIIGDWEDQTANGAIIRLWGEMGEIDQAIALAEWAAEDGYPDIGYLAAGDVCRAAGRFAEAQQYYEKVLQAPDRKGNLKKNKERARASLQAITLFDSLDLTRIPNGMYKGSSMAYTGPLEVEVTVKNGRIENVRVTRHTEKQFYSSITDTTAQIIRKQSVTGIDTTSGATITSEAIINASAKALAGGMR